MTSTTTRKNHDPLLAQLAWFIRLRWIAGGAVIAGSLLNQRWLGWYPWEPYGWRGTAVGAGILFYNLLLLALLARAGGMQKQRRPIFLLAWVQLLLDMGFLTLLNLWTGGLDSPLRGFFVFHMVFASLLLPQAIAYGGAFVAIAMLLIGLWLSAELPATTQSILAMAGWAVMLIFSVFLTNHLTRGLRRQRRRLMRQNKQIRRISRQLQKHQDALVQHEKMVALGQMASGITHEIANPLASMDSLLQLMQRKPEKLRPEAVQTLREQIERIRQIIEQMKSFAHPVEMQRQTLLLNEVLERAVEMVAFDKRIGRVRIEKQFSPDVGEVSLVPQAIQQVMVNLIINALDAMEGVEQPRLLIRTERRDHTAVIEVIDNGHGIPPEHMRRLFEPFFTTKPVGKGTGLGLSISYSLIERQGGSIAVRSAVGKGTTFTIRLPARISHQREGVDKPISAIENRIP